jgi:glycopeptide antibiotics resistance protein
MPALLFQNIRQKITKKRKSLIAQSKIRCFFANFGKNVVETDSSRVCVCLLCVYVSYISSSDARSSFSRNGFGRVHVFFFFFFFLELLFWRSSKLRRENLLLSLTFSSCSMTGELKF